MAENYIDKIKKEGVEYEIHDPRVDKGGTSAQPIEIGFDDLDVDSGVVTSERFANALEKGDPFYLTVDLGEALAGGTINTYYGVYVLSPWEFSTYGLPAPSELGNSTRRSYFTWSMQGYNASLETHPCMIWFMKDGNEWVITYGPCYIGKFST